MIVGGGAGGGTEFAAVAAFAGGYRVGGGVDGVHGGGGVRLVGHDDRVEAVRFEEGVVHAVDVGVCLVRLVETATRFDGDVDGHGGEMDGDAGAVGGGLGDDGQPDGDVEGREVALSGDGAFETGDKVEEEGLVDAGVVQDGGVGANETAGFGVGAALGDDDWRGERGERGAGEVVGVGGEDGSDDVGGGGGGLAAVVVLCGRQGGLCFIAYPVVFVVVG